MTFNHFEIPFLHSQRHKKASLGAWQSIRRVRGAEMALPTKKSVMAMMSRALATSSGPQDPHESIAYNQLTMLADICPKEEFHAAVLLEEDLERRALRLSEFITTEQEPFRARHCEMKQNMRAQHVSELEALDRAWQEEYQKNEEVTIAKMPEYAEALTAFEANEASGPFALYEEQQPVREHAVLRDVLIVTELQKAHGFLEDIFANGKRILFVAGTEGFTFGSGRLRRMLAYALDRVPSEDVGSVDYDPREVMTAHTALTDDDITYKWDIEDLEIAFDVTYTNVKVYMMTQGCMEDVSIGYRDHTDVYECGKEEFCTEQFDIRADANVGEHGEASALAAAVQDYYTGGGGGSWWWDWRHDGLSKGGRATMNVPCVILAAKKRRGHKRKGSEIGSDERGAKR